MIQKFWRGYSARKQITLRLYKKLDKRFNDLEKVYKLKESKGKKFFIPLKIMNELVSDVFTLIDREKMTEKLI